MVQYVPQKGCLLLTTVKAVIAALNFSEECLEGFLQKCGYSIAHLFEADTMDG
jgi:hypothetical protein